MQTSAPCCPTLHTANAIPPALVCHTIPCHTIPCHTIPCRLKPFALYGISQHPSRFVDFFQPPVTHSSIPSLACLPGTTHAHDVMSCHIMAQSDMPYFLPSASFPCFPCKTALVLCPVAGVSLLSNNPCLSAFLYCQIPLELTNLREKVRNNRRIKLH